MSDKARQMTNKVMLIGKVTEFELKESTNKNGIPYMSMKGSIQFGEHKAQERKFEKYLQEYRIKEDGSRKDNKAYPTMLAWARNVKSVAQSSWDAATEVKLQCAFAANDYVSSEEKLIEGLKIEPAFINDVDCEYGATADIEGYIQAIAPETKGEDQTETGRLRVTVLTNDFFGNIIPVKNVIVENELRDAFEDGYEVGQTAKLFIDFVLHKGEEKPIKSGGIGVQRQTDGNSYVEMILTGADPALDEDDKDAMSKEFVKIALAERKAALNTLKEAGYQGSKNSGGTSSGRTSGIGGSNKPAPAADGDIPF